MTDTDPARGGSAGPLPSISPAGATALAFDVYGTLIDPFHMEEHLRASFGDRAKQASELWRAKQLEYTFRRGLMKTYQDFNACTAQALQYVYSRFGVTASDQSLQNVLAHYLRLPAYADAPPAMQMLADSGFTMVACSNGTETAVRQVLEAAGLLRHLAAVISVDPLRTFKPDPAVYESLADRLKTEKSRVWMISSNPFDVIGAKASGLRAVWVQRDETQVFDPWEFAPDLTVSSLTELPQHFSAIVRP